MKIKIVEIKIEKFECGDESNKTYLKK